MNNFSLILHFGSHDKQSNSDFYKKDMCGRGSLMEDFCKSFVKISAMRIGFMASDDRSFKNVDRRTDDEIV